jgi:hypothetical protein
VSGDHVQTSGCATALQKLHHPRAFVAVITLTLDFEPLGLFGLVGERSGGLAGDRMLTSFQDYSHREQDIETIKPDIWECRSAAMSNEVQAKPNCRPRYHIISGQKAIYVLISRTGCKVTLVDSATHSIELYDDSR